MTRGAFGLVDPLTELRTARYRGSAGVLTVAREDRDYRPQAERVAAAPRAAGRDITLQEIPGAHSWSIASDALGLALPWSSGRTGRLDLIRPPTIPH